MSEPSEGRSRVHCPGVVDESTYGCRPSEALSIHPMTLMAKARPRFLHPEIFRMLSKHVAESGIATEKSEAGTFIRWPDGEHTWRSDPIPPMPHAVR